jgi:hypothetical protein
MASNLIDTLNEKCELRNCEYWEKKTSDIFLTFLNCGRHNNQCGHLHNRPCDKCKYYVSDYTTGLAANMLCKECLEKLIKETIVFETTEQIKNYVHDWDELCINCKKNTRNSGDLIDYMERLITKVDSLTKDVNSLAKEVDDIKKAIRIPV